MKTIKIQGDNAYVDITKSELIVIRNSLTEVISEIGGELRVRTGFYLEELEVILDAVVQAIKELE